MPSWAQDRVSTVEGWGLSVSVGPGRSDPFTTHFTTYDGVNNRLPLAENIGGSPLYSREWYRSRQNPLRWYTDYITFGVGGSVVEYGAMELLIPAGDTDFNGVPDVFQTEKAGEFSFSGSLASDFPSRADFSASGIMNRQAGSSTGTYSLRFSGHGRNILYEGNYELVRWTGTVDYTRGQTNSIRFNLNYFQGNGSRRVLSGETPFSVLNREAFSLAPFQLTDDLGRRVSIQATRFDLTGGVYRAQWNMADGNLSTGWTDYLNHIFALSDPNDSDSDGVPDLTDEYIPPAVITQHPQNRAVAAGSTVVLSVEATGAAPITYQWRFNGEDLLFSTARTLTISDFKASNVGTYQVRVGNPGGFVISQDARLDLLQPPTILTQPQSVTTAPGRPVAFSVGVSGNGTVVYQWFRNNQTLVGETASSLQIPQAQTIHQGSYTVSVGNEAGQVTSQPAVLSVKNLSLSVKKLGNDTVEILVQAVAGRELILYQSTDLRQWTEWKRNANPGASNSFVRTVEAGRSYYFRAVQTF